VTPVRRQNRIMRPSVMSSLIMPNQVLCRADPDSRAKRERTGAGIRHNQSDIGNVMSFRPAKVSATRIPENNPSLVDR
jgi:hypothetical protein